MSTLRINLSDDPWFAVPVHTGSKALHGWQGKVPAGIDPSPLPECAGPSTGMPQAPLRLLCSFTLDAPMADAQLSLVSLNGTATVWLNGAPLGDLTGAYSHESIPLKDAAVAGENLLALEIHPCEDRGACFNPLRGAESPAAYLRAPSVAGAQLESAEAELIGRIAIQPDIRRNRIACTVTAGCAGTIEARIDGEDGGYAGSDGEFSLDFERYEAWSPESPRQYGLIVKFTAGDGRCEERHVLFGMREFTIKDQRFHLNGRPYFVHGVAYAPPVSKDAIRRDLEQIKASGFNYIRIFQAGLTPTLAETAGAVGLLIQCCLYVDHPKESQSFLDETMGRFTRTLAPYLNSPALAALSLADASLTITHVDAGETLRRLLPVALGVRALDPSRLIFFGQGFAASTGAMPSFIRPYRQDAEPFCDIVFQGQGSLSPDEDSFLRNVGDESALNFASSLSSAGMSQPENAPEDLGFEESFPERNLERIFDGPPAFRRSAQILQAAGISALISSARGNRNLAGYCYDAWSDWSAAGGTGLNGPDGTVKLSARALHELQVPMRPIIQIQRTNLMVREETSVQVLLTNLERAEGRVELSLQVVGPTNQVLWKKKRSVKLPKHGRELWSGTIAASGSTGRHRFIVRVLQNFQRIAESGCDFVVLDEVAPADQEVHVVDPERRFSPVIAKFLKLQNLLAPVHIIPPLSDTIVAYPDNDLLQILAQVKGGAVAIFFNPPRDTPQLLNMLQPDQAPWQLYDTEDYDSHYQYNRLHPVFDHLPAKQLLGSAYRYIQPRFLSSGGSDEEICGAWLERTTDREDGGKSCWGTSIASRRYGSGRIVVCTLAVLEALDFDPLAQHLLLNLVAHFTRRSIPPLLPLAPETQPVEWMRRTCIGERRKWYLIGEFPNNAATPGHDTEFPPEQEMNTGAVYPGWYRPVTWKLRYAKAADRHHLDFSGALPGPLPAARHCGGGTWYAYAEFNAETRERIRIRLGMHGAAKVWLNGGLAVDESAQPGERSCVNETTVRQGRNTLLVKFSTLAGPAEVELGLEHLSGAPLMYNWWR